MALWVGPLPFRTPPAAGKVYVGKLRADGEAENGTNRKSAAAALAQKMKVSRGYLKR